MGPIPGVNRPQWGRQALWSSMIQEVAVLDFRLPRPPQHTMAHHSLYLFVHILAACIIFGGHMVMSCIILPKAKRAKDPQALLAFERSFERLAVPSLAIQAATGPILANRFYGPSEWFLWENVIQDHIASKLILLVIIIALAISMKLRVHPRLKAGDATALKSAAKHIHTVTFLSFLMVMLGTSINSGGNW